MTHHNTYTHNPADSIRSHFGFKAVDSAQKQTLVNGVFSDVANRYDLMNDAMSGGLHRAWKDTLIARIRPRAHQHLLDVAGGTGDVAERFLRAGGGSVTLVDINHEMLSAGRMRAQSFHGHANMHRAQGNAEALPLADNSTPLYTIAFGLRNVTHIEQALAEAHRVLERGGQFFCLEFSTPAYDWLKRLYDAYSFRAIPLLGQLLAGQKDAYSYLVESIRQFPDADALASLMQEAGFTHTRYTRLSGGIVAIHQGRKL